jgi:type 1 glutamine amidotransferase
LKHQLIVVASVALAGCGAPPPAVEPEPTTQLLLEPAAGQPRLLLFSRTNAFRHDSIPTGIQAVTLLAQQQGLGLTATVDGAQFNDATLPAFGAVMFLNTTGDVLDAEQQSAFERYIRAGGAYVGVHAASDCEYDWPWYGGLVGAYFMGHSNVLATELKLEQVMHPALAGVTAPWTHRDEWYGFRTNPRGQVQVLLSIDETTFDPGPGSMGGDHPVAWCHDYEGGRAFYTALGHTADSYTDPSFLSHLQGGLRWALGLF